MIFRDSRAELQKRRPRSIGLAFVGEHDVPKQGLGLTLRIPARIDAKNFHADEGKCIPDLGVGWRGTGFFAIRISQESLEYAKRARFVLVARSVIERLNRQQRANFGKDCLEMHAHGSGSCRTDNDHERIASWIEGPFPRSSARTSAKGQDLPRELMDHGSQNRISGARKIERMLHIDEGERRDRSTDQKVVDGLFGFTPNESRNSGEPEDAATGRFTQDANCDPSGDAVLEIDSISEPRE